MITHNGTVLPDPDVGNSVSSTPSAVAHKLHQLAGRDYCIENAGVLPANRQVSVHRSTGVNGMLQCTSYIAGRANLDLFGLAAAEWAPKQVRGQPGNTPREDGARP